MKKLLFAFALLYCILPAMAQTGKKTEEEAIKKTINMFFEGMQKRDSSIMMKTITDSCGLQSVFVNRLGEVKLRYETVGDLIISVTKVNPEIKSLDERITFDAIHVDGNLASVWTPYKFYLNGNFSHCGANSFTLAKLNGMWKIINIIDTRRKEGCE